MAASSQIVERPGTQLAGMFPANVNAARKGIRIGGKPPTALWLRVPMQLLYMAVIWLTAIDDAPQTGRSKRIPFRH